MFKACGHPLEGLWAFLWKHGGLCPGLVKFFTRFVGKLCYEQLYAQANNALCTGVAVRFFTYSRGFSTLCTRLTNIKTNSNKGFLVV